MSQPFLDLLILDTHSSKYLAIGDASIYPTGFTPVSPTLLVKPPQYPEKAIAFTPSQVGVYNSYSLGITCDADNCPQELPDGIYRITYSVAPAYENSVERFFLKVDCFYEKFDRAYIALDSFQKDSVVRMQDHKLLDFIEQTIQGAIAAANLCNQKLSINRYKKASQLLDNFLEHRCF